MANTKEPTVELPSLPELARQLKELFTKKVTEQISEFDGEAIVKEITKSLNDQKTAAAMKLLGMNNSWGRWEVDHCNGRSSLIGDYIKSQGFETVKQWIDEAVAEVFTPAFKDKIKADCKTAIRKELMQRNSYQAQKILSTTAEGMLADIYSELAREMREELGITKGN